MKTVGVDLGGTNIKAALVDDDGSPITTRIIPTHAEQGIQSVLGRICGVVRDVAGDSVPIDVVGVTAPAVVRFPAGSIELMPNFPNTWSGYPLRQNLEDMLSIPVHVLNDARAATYAEKQTGVGRSFRDFIYITIGTGVGGGVVMGDRLIMGSRGVAGEIGHMTVEPGGAYCGCGNRGCLETVASGPAIVSAAVRAIRQGFPTLMRDLCDGNLNRITPELVAEAAGQSDEQAIRILTETARYIAEALRNLISVLNPEAVIIGGGIGTSPLIVQLIEDALHKLPAVFPDDLGHVHVLQAAGHAFSGAFGAAAWARTQAHAAKMPGTG